MSALAPPPSRPFPPTNPPPPARLRLGLQASGDVDAIAHHILSLNEHIAEVDPNPVQQRFRGTRDTLHRSKLTLHRQRTGHGMHRTRKRHQQPVTRALQHRTLVGLADASHGVEVLLQQLERRRLVLLHAGAKPDDIREENGSERALS